MQLCLFTPPNLETYLDSPLHPGVDGLPPRGARFAHYARVVGFEPPGPPLDDGPFRRVADAIHTFQVFPPIFLRPLMARTPVSPGDTVGLRVYLAPGVCLFFAARVHEVFAGPADRVWRSGFTYRTVEGHLKRGEETFCVEKDMQSGRVTASLRSWSVPSIWFLAPVDFFIRAMQRLASRSALLRLQQAADGR